MNRLSFYIDGRRDIRQSPATEIQMRFDSQAVLVHGMTIDECLANITLIAALQPILFGRAHPLLMRRIVVPSGLIIDDT